MKINNRTVKQPKAITYDLIDIEGNTFTNALGMVVRDILAPAKVTLEVEWGAMSPLELSDLLLNLNKESFTVTYLDGSQGRDVTKTFFCSEKTAPVYSYANGLPTWEGLSATLQEV